MLFLPALLTYRSHQGSGFLVPFMLRQSAGGRQMTDVRATELATHLGGPMLFESGPAIPSVTTPGANTVRFGHRRPGVRSAACPRERAVGQRGRLAAHGDQHDVRPWHAISEVAEVGRRTSMPAARCMQYVLALSAGGLAVLI